MLHRPGKARDAVAAVQRFHRGLTQMRVLDPACGSGNLLYVTLEHLKRLEGEVLSTLDDMGKRQGLLELAGVTVDPHHLLGLEVNPRAARVAEAVLYEVFAAEHRPATPPSPSSQGLRARLEQPVSRRGFLGALLPNRERD